MAQAARNANETRSYSTKELVKRCLPYYRPYRKTMLFDLVCAAATTGAELTLPLIIRHLTNLGLSDLGSLTLTTVVHLALLYAGLRLLDLAASWFMCYQGHVMGTYMETDMRNDAYAHLLKLSNAYYAKTKIGQILGRITNDLFDITEFAHHCPEEFFIAAVKAVGAFVILVRVNVWLTLLVFAMVPVMFVFCLRASRREKHAFAAMRHEAGELNAQIEDSLLGYKVVRAFANEDLEQQKFSNENSIFFKVKRATYRYMASFQCTVRLFDGLMYLLVVIGGGLFLLRRAISPGDLVAFVMYGSTLIATIRRIVEYTEMIQRGITGVERFVQIMDADIDIFDEPDAVPLSDPKGEITFSHVDFAYPDDRDKAVIRDLSLTIHPGEKLAIVGPSGGGKTTLCSLIPRFYDVDAGSITIDGTDIRHFTLKSLRGCIGTVQQDVYLFSGSVYDNIVYGRPDATREEVIEAAKRAGVDDFVSHMPDGYDTYLGERGVRLSGGQKQRISIARIFLKNPPIILLDEATSALDNESEYEVAKALSELAKGRTTLTIAHRLTSIVHSDRILVLTENGIEEEGNHTPLMEKKGIYYRFYTRAMEVQ